MPYPIETIAKIAARHGLAGELRRLPDTGMCNDAWQIGETHVLRVPHKAEWERESFVEALAVPAARLAGVCTPALVALGDERDLTPLAYTLYERALGVPLGTLDLQPMDCPGLWAELARQMLLMHRGVLDIPGADGVIGNPFVHPARENLKKARAQKLLEPGEIEEIAAWIDALEASPGAPPGKVFLHRDLHPWNLLVDPGTCTLEAIIDWGDAAFGDLALEFSSLPLGVIPLTLAEYRSDGGEVDGEIVPRILLHWLGLALWELRLGDPNVFRRHWWCWPVGGWAQAKRELAFWPSDLAFPRP